MLSQRAKNNQVSSKQLILIIMCGKTSGAAVKYNKYKILLIFWTMHYCKTLKKDEIIRRATRFR